MHIYMSVFHIFQEVESPEEIQYAPPPQEKKWKLKNKKLSLSQCNARHYLEINTPRQNPPGICTVLSLLGLPFPPSWCSWLATSSQQRIGSSATCSEGPPWAASLKQSCLFIPSLAISNPLLSCLSPLPSKISYKHTIFLLIYFIFPTRMILISWHLHMKL